MARAATSPELALYRTPGKWTKLRAAIFQPTSVWTGRINQTFSSLDGVLEITYDGGSSTTNVREDMTMYIGSAAGLHDVGIVRVRSIDGSKVYIGETSDVLFADNQYLTIVDEFTLWARHVLIDGTTPYMDGTIAYSDQHANFDPVPIIGSHRVFKLTGASVSDQRNLASSYVVDGTAINSYLTGAPTASSVTNPTTSTPTIVMNTVGWHRIYCAVGAANGKSFSGRRYDYVWSDANPPPRVAVRELRGDADEGGWSCEITLLDNCDLDDIPDRTLVIIFGEDYYGATQSNIGPETGSENIYFIGWISKESINWSPEQGSVSFQAHGAHWWLSQIPAYPDGVELVTGTPAAWTEIQSLTVNKGLFHFLRWRTTATAIMDCFLTDDTKYTKEVSSLAQNLWEQIQEMSFLQIFARPGVNALGQLYIEVHPQLVPSASRTWPNVITITKPDWTGEIEFDRVILPEMARLNLSGVAVNESGNGLPYFSLAPGHVFGHYGRPEIQDQLLLSSQSQANTLAGLYWGWRNNPYPDIQIKFDACIRLIDLFPRQKCFITINPSDTPRGITYESGLIPKTHSIIYDPENGYIHSEITFEATNAIAVEFQGVDGDVPGSGDTTVPPDPDLPDLPDLPIVIPGTGGEEDIATAVLLHDANKGLLYSSNFDEASPTWITVNAGLTSSQANSIDKIVLTPSGGIYVARRGRTGQVTPFIAFAPSIGGTFTIIEDVASIIAKLTHSAFVGVNAIGVDPLTGQAGYVISANDGFGTTATKLYLGTGTTFSAAAVNLDGLVNVTSRGSLTYGFGNWRLTGSLNNIHPRLWVISSGGGSLVRNVVTTETNGATYHIPVSTTDELYMMRSDGLLHITDNGANSAEFTTILGSLLNEPVPWDNYFACDLTGLSILGDWDTGRRGKSSDGSSTWGGLPNLPVGGPYAICYAGGSGSASCWIAGAGILRYSDDFGNTWVNKEGNITSIAPFPSINIVKAIGFHNG